MTPADVSVVTVDGFIHAVITKTVITIRRHEGGTEENPGPLQEKVSTRYTCGCGITVDYVDAELDADARWTQGGTPDCPNGC